MQNVMIKFFRLPVAHFPNWLPDSKLITGYQVALSHHYYEQIKMHKNRAILGLKH